MASFGNRAWLLACGLVTSACALAGYDFDEYERASVDAAGAFGVAIDAAGAGGAPSAPQIPGPSGAGTGPEPVAQGGAEDEAVSGGGAPDAAEAPTASTFGVGGEPAACVPRTCTEQSAECGMTDDGCGGPL